MMTEDLFAEFGEAAAEYGWRGIGQPLPLARRYGRQEGDSQVTVSVFANASGTAIVGAVWASIMPSGKRQTIGLRSVDRDKRDRVLEWLRS
jgi:hypothetical protein